MLSLILLCRILRRQDRPTAHPRHREYASPLATNQRRDTDRRRRQLTRLPKPFPQYPPFTLRYGMMRLLRRASGAVCAGQWPWGSARTFDVIVLTERGMRPHLLPLHPHSAGSLCVQSHAAAKSHLHTDYEREHVPLFAKVQRGRCCQRVNWSRMLLSVMRSSPSS